MLYSSVVLRMGKAGRRGRVAVWPPCCVLDCCCAVLVVVCTQHLTGGDKEGKGAGGVLSIDDAFVRVKTVHAVVQHWESALLQRSS